MIDHDLSDRAMAWRDLDPDPETRRGVDALLEAGDAEGLRDLFSGSLQFGTAGLRGPMGPGPNRMNRVVVQRAASGLMRVLPSGASVVIGWDARANSEMFALDTARVVAAAGGTAMLLACAAPTPLLAFAVRHLAADAGVMVTASHNPAGDNGYKVYMGDGAQVVPPVDAEIAAAIELVGSAGVVAMSREHDPRIVRLDTGVEDAYVEHAVLAVGAAREGRGTHHDVARGLTIAYTPLHGIGGAITRRVFERLGFDPLRVVTEQAEPDATFPTVTRPNPEEPGTLDRLVSLAVEVGADLALAHDPDADRLGVLVPDGEEWVALTGNQIGALLAEHLLVAGHGPNRLVVTTLASSHLLARMAERHRVHFAEVPTGFKWIARPAIEHPEWDFVFGYEEALGFSVDAYVRDKDGITAAAVFAEMFAALRAEGCTVWDRLAQIDDTYGRHVTMTRATRFGGDARAGRAAADAVMRRLREGPPQALGGRRVLRMIDHAHDGAGPVPTDAVALEMEGGARVVVRPSGTEALLKCYLEVVVAPGHDARGILSELYASLVEALDLGGVDAAGEPLSG